MTPRVVAAVLAATLSSLAAPALACGPERVTVAGAFGEAAFTVTVADDPDERAQGLMMVPAIPAMTGMLFVYERPQPVAFWMRNTLIELDMIFADADGTIRRIHDRAVPLDETPIPGGDDIQFVLEVNGGMAERLGMAEGDALRHPAIAPCDAGAAPDAAPED
ncbi:MAG: DUF192 domain-containing protein [Paracoccaceae bacterium]